MPNVLLERQVVAGLLHHPALLAQKGLTAEHFSERFSEAAVGAIGAILRDGKVPDVISVDERMGTLRDVSRLLSDWEETRPANRDTVAGWADALLTQHRRDGLRNALSDAQRSAEANESPETVVADLLQKIGALNASTAAYAKSIKEVLAGFVDTVEQRFAHDGSLLGIPTGLTDLDDVLLGLQPGCLYILGARPAMGKTALMSDWAVHAALQGHGVGIVSAEMSSEQLAARMVSSTGRIDHHHINTGKLDDDEWPRLTSASMALAKTRLLFFDRPACSPSDISLQARAWAMGGGLDILFVDYLSLLRPDAKAETRAREVGDMAQRLKQLARTLKIPVICLAQLNRELEKRPNKRPIAADLRDSGEIEQEADVILFLYRDEVYHQDSRDKGMAEIIIGKNRHGMTGTIRAVFLGQYQRFENFIRDEVPKGYDPW